MSNWVIISMLGNIGVYTNEGKFSPDVKEARYFDTKAEAEQVAVTIKTATVVQQLEPFAANASKYNFPVPDFFEGNPPTMSLDELIWFIRQEELAVHFTPVDKITGANQMTGTGITHPFDHTLVGREYQFSFARLLNDEDASAIHDVALKTGWDSISYIRKRLGFTSYGVLTLRSKNK